MWGIIAKIWFFIVILPYFIVQEGYEMLKKFMAKHGYHLDFLHVLLGVLILILIILLLLEYGYR